MQSMPSPTFAIVSAVYGVAAYLPAFIASVEDQLIDSDELEIIAVDDGSIDGSADILHRWAAESRFRVKVLTKENGGQASARNLGIEHVTAPWVSFADPDDMLEESFFLNVKKFLSVNAEVDAVATNLIFFEEQQGCLRNGHPRKWMFQGGDQAVDLESFPDYNFASCGAALLRRATIQDAGLQFPEDLKPIFEDAFFLSHYLLQSSRPIVGVVASAHYHYRRRSDGSSTLQASHVDERRFTVVPRSGYLEVLKYASERSGSVPLWLQGLIIYELSWFFGPEQNMKTTVRPPSTEVGAEFLRTMREIAQYLAPERVFSYSRRPLRFEVRHFLAFAARTENWRSDYVVLDRFDESSKTVRLRFRFSGAKPNLEILVRGRPSHHTISKVRSFSYFGHAILKEVIAFAPADGTLRVLCDGREVELRTDWKRSKTTALRPAQLRRRFMHRPKPRTRQKLKIWFPRRLARTRFVRRLYQGSWVLLDRIHNAGDNAERFFEYLRTEKPLQKAYFIIDTSTKTGKILKRRYGGRVVHYGSLRWKLLMLNCDHLISSHADAPVIRPKAITQLGRPTWKTTFLQHGVTKDDLSRWLNEKPIDLFVTSTHAEADSLRGDGSPYTYTPAEVRVLGFPRFDRLLSLKSTVDKKKQILVMPTWRDSLSGQDLSNSQDKGLKEGIEETVYFRSWRTFLQSAQVKSLAESGWNIVFHPHSNMAAVLDLMHLGEHIKVLRHGERDIQELIVESQIMVTDYSSVAFDAAFTGTDLMYYQFDHAEFWSGAHTMRRGYFDYVRDGFGPVAFTHEEAVDFLMQVATQGPDLKYRERSNATMFLDSQNCERVYEAIRDLDRPYFKKRHWELPEPTSSQSALEMVETVG